MKKIIAMGALGVIVLASFLILGGGGEKPIANAVDISAEAGTGPAPKDNYESCADQAVCNPDESKRPQSP